MGEPSITARQGKLTSLFVSTTIHGLTCIHSPKRSYCYCHCYHDSRLLQHHYLSCCTSGSLKCRFFRPCFRFSNPSDHRPSCNRSNSGFSSLRQCLLGSFRCPWINLSGHYYRRTSERQRHHSIVNYVLVQDEYLISTIYCGLQLGASHIRPHRPAEQRFQRQELQWCTPGCLYCSYRQCGPVDLSVAVVLWMWQALTIMRRELVNARLCSL